QGRRSRRAGISVVTTPASLGASCAPPFFALDARPTRDMVQLLRLDDPGRRLKGPSRGVSAYFGRTHARSVSPDPIQSADDGRSRVLAISRCASVRNQILPGDVGPLIRRGAAVDFQVSPVVRRREQRVAFQRLSMSEGPRARPRSNWALAGAACGQIDWRP